MGSLVVACYRPIPGREQLLLDLVREHVPILRNLGLVTTREPVLMRSSDGVIVEVFEWLSPEAVAGAHSNPAVLELWKRFESLCTFERPAQLKEFQEMFAHFEPI